MNPFGSKYKPLRNIVFIVGYIALFAFIGYGLTNFQILLLSQGWILIIILMDYEVKQNGQKENKL